MTNVAEELAFPNAELTKEHVVQRVDNWKHRVSELYDIISEWLPPDIDVERDGRVSMHEDTHEAVRGARNITSYINIGARPSMGRQTCSASLVDYWGKWAD